MAANYPDSGSSSEPEPPGSFSPQVLQHDGERFRLLVENSRDVIVEISSRNEILYVSPNATAMLGYAPDELIGRDLMSGIHADDRAEVRRNLELRTGLATCRYRHRDGSWRWIEGTGREFTATDGTTHRVLVARDVTEQRHAASERNRLEAELARAEKLTALGTLAGGMAHDFNNLLTAVLAYATLAREQTSEPNVRAGLDQIVRAAERAKSIARHVLDFSSQRPRVRTAVDLAALAQEVLTLLRPTIPAQIEVVADLREDAGTVPGNAAQLHQVLVNLCQNALDAMSRRRGRLVVRVERLEAETIPGRPPGLPPGPHVCLSVSDNGRGMDAATQSRIFEPFFTTKLNGDGSGLGLAVVQRIVRDHRGVIDVSSRRGEGTVFRVFFACERQPLMPTPSGSDAANTAP